jgi:hypothetical protein
MHLAVLGHGVWCDQPLWFQPYRAYIHPTNDPEQTQGTAFGVDLMFWQSLPR